jgi:hydroxypyruvate isomerase
MSRFSANLGFLWSELPLVARIHAAKRANFSAVECHWPYDTRAADVKEALQETGLEMLALNTEPGNLPTGEFGLAAIPGKQTAARAGIDKALYYATAIGARNIHVMAGIAGDSADVMAVYLDNITYAAKICEQHNTGILIEPINHIDRPGYTLHTVSQALDVINKIRESGSYNVRLMFDCYHAKRTGANIVGQLKTAMPFIEHIQIASVPDRAEPDHGEIYYPDLIRKIDLMGYKGFIGAEYIPQNTTEMGLGWLQSYRENLTGNASPIMKTR